MAPCVEPLSSSSAERLLPARGPVLLFVTCFGEGFLQRGKVLQACEGLWDLGSDFQDAITDFLWLYLRFPRRPSQHQVFLYPFLPSDHSVSW